MCRGAPTLVVNFRTRLMTPMETSIPSCVRVGAFEFDRKAGELRTGHRKVRLQEQPFQILLMLVERSGGLVTREEIQKKLWPNDTVVEFDHSIHAAINKLRQAFGDAAEHPKYIETVARRGYRLMVLVERVHASSASSPLEVPATPVPEPSASSLSGKRVSHYRVLELLGGGGMGVVYKAEDLKLGRRVALKFLPEEIASDAKVLERFEREARAASALDHPNICAIYEFGEHEGQPFIAMPSLEGQTLRDRIAARAAPFATDELLNLAIQIGHGLAAAHEKGITHRDIKPANIFITNRSEAKILDFGLAKLTDAGDLEGLRYQEARSGKPQTAPANDLSLSLTGMAMGTAPYMSPEQVRGEKLDARSDLYSFGLVVYEMATGTRAFIGDTSAALHEAILNRTAVPARELNPELPLKLEEIINKALGKDREARYQTAAEMCADLKQLNRDKDSGRAAQLSEIVPTGRAKPWWYRIPALLGGGLALITLLTLGAWFAFFRPQGGAIESVAVLPFSNGTSDSNAEYLSDGITEGLINNLSQLPNLRVIARSTVYRYKGKEADPQMVGNDLHVHAVLSGRLLQHGDTLIVQAVLMNVRTGAQLWGGQFSRKMEDVFALQADLSKEIAEKLHLRLTGEEKQLLAQRYTWNAEAYQSYLKGRYYWNKRSQEGTQKAAEYFQQAIEKDPAYALAYAGLADTYVYLSFFNVVPPRDVMPRAKAIAEKALEIDDHLAEAYVSLGYISFTYDWDWQAAGKHFDQALSLKPIYTRAHYFYPFYLSSSGRSQEALAAAKSALDLDPASPSLSQSLAVQFYFARQFDQAIEQCHKTLEMDPNFAVAYAVLGQSYLAKGMNREAVPVMQKYSALSQASADSLALLGYSYARLEERGQAQRILQELTAVSKERFVPAFFFALVYTGLEDKDQAFTWLERAYVERYTRFAYLKLEALWDPLRSDQRFSDLVRRVGIPP